MERLLTLSRRSRTLPWSVRYLCTTLLVLAALVVRMALDDALRTYPFILFYPVVILATLLFDRGTAIYATLLSGLLALYFFLPPRDSLVLFDAAILVPLALFFLTCGIAAVTIEMLHSVNDRYAAALERAEKAERVRETLMREMSHRIKNKLQFLAATFNMHARSRCSTRRATARSTHATSLPACAATCRCPCWESGRS
jgi:K+-sensing histidine kinase KdpD